MIALTKTATVPLDGALLPECLSEGSAERGLGVVHIEGLSEDRRIIVILADSTRPQAIQHGSVAFGEFHLLPRTRQLLRRGSSVSIGSRAFDVLALLVERAGEVVSNKEIEARAYSGATVSEGAIRFQISALRKVLGDGVNGSRYIINVSGRGYCFAMSTVCAANM